MGKTLTLLLEVPLLEKCMVLHMNDEMLKLLNASSQSEFYRLCTDCLCAMSMLLVTNK